MSRKAHIETEEMLRRLERLDITRSDAESLRRISMTLHRWHELECGDGHGHIERDEATNVPRYYNDTARYFGANDVRRGYVIADREKGALKRLAAIMSRYPTLTAYVQGDPRGASLYILKPGDVPDGASVDSYYSRGVAVYK